MRPVVLVAALLVALAPAGCMYALYDGHALLDHPHAERLGCVDVRVESVPYDRLHGIESETQARGHTWITPFMHVTLGNACGRPVHVDLGRLSLEAVYADGVRQHLATWDPRHEIREAVLDDSLIADETFAFDGYALDDRPRQLCVSLAGVEVGASADAPPICFDVGGAEGSGP